MPIRLRDRISPFVSRVNRANWQSKGYRRSPKQERTLAKKLGGLRHSRSGAGLKKGDISLSRVVRVECKSTQQKSFYVSREMVDKITNAAGVTDELPVIVVEFLDERGNATHELVVISMQSFQGLLDATAAQAKRGS
jgi:Holliday junction resolvase